MRSEELIDAFSWYLPEGDALLAEIESDTCEDWDTCEHASDFVDALFDALQEIAPPLCYFGAAKGDGSDYGFWPMMDVINEEIHFSKTRENEYVLLEDSDVWAHVSDHGNLTLLENDNGKPGAEIWSIV
jgi:hypothetical protein